MNRNQRPETPLIEADGVAMSTGEGRLLFSGLSLSLSRERVALIGRNGVGKSTLLAILAGEVQPDQGRIASPAKPHFVRQTLGPAPEDGEAAELLQELRRTFPKEVLDAEFSAAGLKRPEARALSPGEFRKLKLLGEKLARAELLLLDEPTQDLDESGVSWLRAWLAERRGGLLVASHDARLLQDFGHFFIVAETGCRLFSGSFAEFERELKREHRANEERYVRNLNRLIEHEEHTFLIARRRARKKQYGRVSELGRATPRARLNQKRDYAQVKHGRMKRVRDARLGAAREWTKATRRALSVELPLVLPAPMLPPAGERDLISLKGVAAMAGETRLFSGLDLRQRRERLAVVGPNGAGKTTLLEIMLGLRRPAAGSVVFDRARIGAIAQGGTDWMMDESLVSHLVRRCAVASPESAAGLLIAHKFPLALASRPMRSLSPGERVRAALICLFQRSPVVELLVLDEPTYSLDLLGQGALTAALKAWPGGLVVASHNRTFLQDIGIERYLELGT